MTRTTKADLQRKEDLINRYLHKHGYSVRLFVQYAYGRPRAYEYTIANDMRRELSPRLPTGEMDLWLTAFAKGLELGLMESESPQL